MDCDSCDEPTGADICIKIEQQFKIDCFLFLLGQFFACMAN